MFEGLKKSLGLRHRRVMVLSSPIAGRVLPLADVSDQTFADGLLGEGVAIQPTGDRVVAPADAKIETIFPTGYAVALHTHDGLDVLVHVGLDTVALRGRHFTVHVETGEDSAVITCDASSFSIKTLDAEDFPGFPHVDTQQAISIPFSQFSSMVKRVARVVSKDESRAILTGVLITFEGETLKMVATDSYRLAITEAQLGGPAAEGFQAVISGSFLQELASLTRTDDPLTIALAENQIVVTYHDTVFINRRIEGNFPNYRQLLPDSYATRVRLNVSHLVSGVKRTSILGQQSSPVKFAIDVESQTVQLSAAAQDVGSAQETLACQGEGENVEIAFNYAYVLDGLGSVNTDDVFLEVQSGMKPGIFKAGEGENFLYLVMPVRIS